MDMRVFLVEDLQNMRTLMTELFAVIGGLAIVASASTEAEAKLWLRDHPGACDLVIVDLVLDQGSGMEVIRHARGDVEPPRVVVFSSYTTPGVVTHCLALGAEAVFDKSDSSAFVMWLYDQVDASGAGPALH